MLKLSIFQKNKTTILYTFWGTIFGLCFPTIALLIRSYQGLNFVDAHRHDELIWIIDTAPVILAIFAFFIGRKQSQLETASDSLADRFRMVSEGTKLALWEWNVATNEILVDDTWYQIVGREKKSPFINREDFLKNVHPDDLALLNNSSNHHFEQKTEVYNVVYRYRHTNGKWIYIHRRAKNIINEKNEIVVVGTAVDVTEKIEHEKSFEENRKQLAVSSQMASLGEMAGGIAHEINNPLTIINAKAGQMKTMLETGEVDKEKLITAFNKIEETVYRISRIIKGLKSLSRNADADPLEETKFTSIFEDVLTLCRERYRINGVELRIANIPDFTVKGRHVQLSQVIMNLLNNAFDAIEKLDEKWIEVTFAKKGDQILISVIDSGHGIDEKTLEKIMTPFFTTKDPGKGTGLGLSISKSIVEQHGGKLFYELRGQNTCFVIALPISKEKTQVA